jgi:hypothetical protein
MESLSKLPNKQAGSKEEQELKDASRRKAVKSIAVGSAVVGAAALIPFSSLAYSKMQTKLLAPAGAHQSDSNVGYFAYAYLGQIGTATPTRDSTGAISSINYQSGDGTAGVNVNVARNSDGSIASVSNNVFDNNLSPPVSITATANVNRNPDGSISNIVWS